jgi:hypothetical protein
MYDPFSSPLKLTFWTLEPMFLSETNNIGNLLHRVFLGDRRPVSITHKHNARIADSIEGFHVQQTLLFILKRN